MASMTDAQLQQILSALNTIVNRLGSAAGAIDGVKTSSQRIVRDMEMAGRSAANLSADLKKLTSASEDEFKTRRQSDRVISNFNDRMSKLSNVVPNTSKHLVDLAAAAQDQIEHSKKIQQQADKEIQDNISRQSELRHEISLNETAYRAGTVAIQAATTSFDTAKQAHEAAVGNLAAAQDRVTELMRQSEIAQAAGKQHQARTLAQAAQTINATLMTLKQHVDTTAVALTTQQNNLDNLNAIHGEAIKKGDSLAKELNDLQEAVVDTRKIYIDAAAHEKDMVKVREESIQKAAKSAMTVSNALNIAKNKLMSWSQSLGTAGKIAVGAAATLAYQGQKAEIARGLNTNAPGTAVSYTEMASMGMTPAEFAELSGEYRHAMLSAGGLSDSVNLIKQSQEELKHVIPDLKDQTKFAADNLNLMSRVGIKPNTKNISLMNEALAKNIKISGETGEQFMGNIRDIIEDESMMTRMRMASSEDERQSILKNTQQRYAELKAMGMTTEQAKAASKALNKMAAEGPMERLKKSVMLTATMGAMGMSGADRMGELYRKGTRRNAQEEREFQKGMSTLSNEMSTAVAGFDTMAFATEALGQKTGFNAETLADLNTKFAETVGENIKPAADKMELASTEMVNAVHLFETATSQIANNPWVQLGIGVGALTAAVAANTIASGINTIALLKGGLSNLKDWFKGGGPGGTAAAKATASRAGIAAQLAGTSPALARAGAVASSNKLALAGAGLKTMGPLAAIGGVISGGMNYLETGKAGESVGAGLGATAGGLGGAAIGSVAGGIVGSLAGPAGTVIGSWLGGAIGGWFGGSKGEDLGKSIGASFDEDKTKKPIEDSMAKVQSETAKIIDDKTQQAVENAKLATVKDAMSTTATDTQEGGARAETEKAITAQTLSIEQQLRKMDEANNHLKVVADNVPTLVEIANKQLLAMSLTEKEKGDPNRIGRIRRDSGFGATYQYL